MKCVGPQETYLEIDDLMMIKCGALHNVSSGLPLPDVVNQAGGFT